MSGRDKDRQRGLKGMMLRRCGAHELDHHHDYVEQNTRPHHRSQRARYDGCLCCACRLSDTMQQFNISGRIYNSNLFACLRRVLQVRAQPAVQSTKGEGGNEQGRKYVKIKAAIERKVIEVYKEITTIIFRRIWGFKRRKCCIINEEGVSHVFSRR